MDFKEYERQVVRAARIELRDIPEWTGRVCVDTIKKSWEEGLTIDLAKQRVVDDTLYWEGLYG